MMTNLFSTFDPATSPSLSMNWISTFIIFMIPSMYWMIPNRPQSLINFLMKQMYTEYKSLLGKSSQGMSILFMSMFIFILMNNMFGLLPYIFTSSSHLTYSLAMALPLWMSMMIFGWINKTQEMFAHLIPMGTPPILMPFMVMIESISNMIRPGSLAVRLTANMIAGHLLMSLLGNKMTEPNMMMGMIIIIQTSMMMFETAVSIIQAYVFSILATLYSSEVNYV